MVAEPKTTTKTTTTTTTDITFDHLFELAAELPPFEIVNGEVVEMSPVGVLHHLIAGNIYNVLYEFVRKNELGYVFFDSLIYVLREEGEFIRLTRIPDVSFVKSGRFPKDFDLRKPFPGAPDVAVEVISPNESAQSVREKVRDYLNYGSTQVWVVYPDEKELHLFRQAEQNTIHILKETDTLDASEVIAHLKIDLKAFFTLPELD